METNIKTQKLWKIFYRLEDEIRNHTDLLESEDVIVRLEELERYLRYVVLDKGI